MFRAFFQTLATSVIVSALSNYLFGILLHFARQRHLPFMMGVPSVIVGVLLSGATVGVFRAIPLFFLRHKSILLSVMTLVVMNLMLFARALLYTFSTRPEEFGTTLATIFHTIGCIKSVVEGGTVAVVVTFLINKYGDDTQEKANA